MPDSIDNARAGMKRTRPPMSSVARTFLAMMQLRHPHHRWHVVRDVTPPRS